MGGEEYAAGDSETGEEGVMSPSSGDEREGGEGAEKVPKEKKKRGPKRAYDLRCRFVDHGHFTFELAVKGRTLVQFP